MFVFSALARRPALLFGAVLMAAVGGIVAGLEALPSAGTPEPVWRMASWAVARGDNAGLPFVVMDKASARVFSFDAKGGLRDSAPALLGAQQGDEPGSSATPAGRFVAEPGANGLRWVNAKTEIELHTADSPRSPGRAQRRLASNSARDRRISEGSITVPTEFFVQELAPLSHRATVAYVLPERRQFDNSIWRTPT